ncbi:hypothetical protein ACFXB3_14255 [Streptomyces sp. NPDC059447]|uniref:hypothetical protein n=1 Tax=Streptomyces sp. NPDC059447 TaxID=3346834 RepID=UPI0036A69239
MRSTPRTRRTALRTAAVVTGAAAVMALPVGSAFADSPAVPEPQVLPGIEQPSVEPSVDPSVKPEIQPPVKPSEKPVEKPVEKPKPSVRAYVTTVKLADGSIAKVYKISDNHFEADILSGGTKLDTLVSKGGAASYGQNNGLHVVLQPNGTVTSWVEGAEKPGPGKKPEAIKESSVRVTMPDGRIAKLVEGSKGKRVDISMPNGNALGTIDLKHPSVQNDGWTYKLVQDGKRVKFVVIDGRGGGNSWVYDFDGRLIEKYTVDAKRDTKRETKRETGKADVTKDVAKPAVERIVPKGGVKAGAEGVATADSDTPLLLAAGGGMAAVGAGGLGFAMLRRNRT